MKIGYLGPDGTYCYEAMKKYMRKCNIEAEKIPYNNITDTILGIKNGEIDKCVVPIENSIQGSVLETMDTLREKEGLYIQSRIVIDIKHHLMSTKKYKPEEIKKIYSHPQALAQCRKYIHKNYPNCEIKQVSSTALAAEKILNEENCACICNEACREIYNLEDLDQNIQDVQNNQTTFIVISKEKNNDLKGEVTTSIFFSVYSKPGELYKVLGLFNIFEVNLNKIESRPAKTKLGEYIFWVDFEADENWDYIKILLEQIDKRCSYFRCLGTYDHVE